MQNQWDASYTNGENSIFYPHNELLRFLNRFIKKQTAFKQFTKIYAPPPANKTLKALDFGCGSGRQTLLLSEFEIEAYGIDISQTAIKQAQSLAKHLKLSANFLVSNSTTLPFANNFFDFSISCGVLNCMPLKMAIHFLNELARVSQKYCFLTLLGKSDSTLSYTMQDKTTFKPIAFFSTQENITEMLKQTSFKLKWGEESLHTNLLDNAKSTYFTLVLEK
ncbi:class I SAM-dependent methyltransferase [Helicobacter sp.]|uniref:class I SAM-dependent methyltransferase n=1 Tax=Helicobacter sp. TaxID=218 RepID=UPI0025B8F08B|nr:class I SAM-dependent methyltransferase [Helicobacter sp.]MCI5969115.1 class I SAM-dependent methyltransferase [Helicobacter sp.]MDY2584690.1 class I SAM-dependent methyltransferase [Helicobacter sp.]